MIDDARRALARIPTFAGRSLAGVEVARLGGLTNSVHRVSLGGEAFALRLAGAGTGRYIDRAAEGHNAAVAADLGLAPELVFFDPADGTMLTRLVPDAAPLDAAAFADAGTLAQATAMLRRLHRSGRVFHGRLDPFAKFDGYLRLAGPPDAAVAAALADARAAADPLRRALARRPEPLVPCHVDPSPENFVRGGAALVLVDWEYSAMCEPTWDLADFSVEAGLDAGQDAALLAAYHGTPDARALARFALGKAVVCLIGAAWAALRMFDANAGDDVARLMDRDLAQFKALLADPAFAHHLAAA